ncbi:Proteasome subunit beta type-7-B [Hibiscus syriacus]|uniref:Proteasome subunit beta type-7-B n=1 Tax=Hibiscus syriacus TaxID=106335 RepID=A0A6A2XTM4_HIBSY|nr:Proteasome subunit beta type-7-B [Hibiscus syriacus]
MPPKGGFSFDLCKRNEMLAKKGVNPPSIMKTGTTIVGLIFQDGVILGADTRATEGPIVCDKNYMVSSQLQLHHYHTGRESRVVTALTLLNKHLFNYQGQVSAALVLGGVDVTGPHLHTVQDQQIRDKAQQPKPKQPRPNRNPNPISSKPTSFPTRTLPHPCLRSSRPHSNSPSSPTQGSRNQHQQLTPDKIVIIL